MRIIKIESCSQCLEDVRHVNAKIRDCTRSSISVIFIDRVDIHPDCPLDKYIDIESIKDLCSQPHDSYRDLASDILDVINL